MINASKLAVTFPLAFDKLFILFYEILTKEEKTDNSRKWALPKKLKAKSKNAIINANHFCEFIISVQFSRVKFTGLIITGWEISRRGFTRREFDKARILRVGIGQKEFNGANSPGGICICSSLVRLSEAASRKVL